MDSKILYLRSLTLESVLKSYKEGEFLKLSLKDIASIETVQPIVLNVNHKDTSKAIVYTVTETDYFPITESKLAEGIRCIHCLRKIVDRNFIGIPISCDYQQDHKIFHCVDVFCTFNCCFSELQPRARDPRTASLYGKSLVLLNLIFSEYYPNNEIKGTAYDRRYLKIFNGPMGYKEFHQDSFAITEMKPNITILQRPLERR